MSELHICMSRKDEERVSFQRCPSCKRKKAQFYGWFQEWYGWALTCTECGEKFADGEWLERPWCPGWREQNILNALYDIGEMKNGNPNKQSSEKEEGR